MEFRQRRHTTKQIEEMLLEAVKKPIAIVPNKNIATIQPTIPPEPITTTTLITQSTASPPPIEETTPPPSVTTTVPPTTTALPPSISTALSDAWHYSSSNYEINIIYGIGDWVERRTKMGHLGLDIGTKTIVCSYKDDNGKTRFISEINGYWVFDRATPFIENMLNDPTKVRSDGTKRAARYFKHPETNQIIVIGRDAEEFAYAKNDTIQRPMAEGAVTPDDMSMTVLSSIIHGILTTAEHDLGEFDDNTKLCYCTTAAAINKSAQIEYHQRVVNMILEGYPTKLHTNTIKESHAIVLEMSPDGTGIGISWGAGTVTVSYVKYGLEVYSFCWVGSGDWIDENVASRHGYDPSQAKTMKSKAKETPTTVSKAKMGIDLTPGVEQPNRLLLDISLHYDVLINQVINGIIQGFQDNESQARIDGGISIYQAGGTSSPKGFNDRVKQLLAEATLPFHLSDVIRAEQPLYTVASGCLKAAEMF